jgi:hypothetical protein
MSRQEVRITQEFLNRYVSLDPLPAQARVGDALQVSGQLLLNTSNPLINLTYEPFPICEMTTHRLPTGCQRIVDISDV